MQRGSESKRMEGRKQRSRDKEGDREKKEKRERGCSVDLQMIAFHTVVFYAT